MGHDDQVEVDEPVRLGDRHDPAQGPDPGARGRVGQDAYAVELDEQRGVPDEVDLEAHPTARGPRLIARRSGRRPGTGGRAGRAPAPGIARRGWPAPPSGA